MMSQLPKISIVTPSYNQAPFLEETLRSVIGQEYPNFEYIVQDGGSTDGSVEIIRKYESRIDFWESGPDGGQSAAINKGFRRATGDFLMWINSDDRLAPGCLQGLAQTGELKPGRIVAGRCDWIDKKGALLKRGHQTRVRGIEDLFEIRHLWFRGGGIIQPETAFCRELFWKAGALDEANHTCMDYDIWFRMFREGGELIKVPVDVGVFRRYEGQKVSFDQKLHQDMCGVALRYLEEYPDLFPPRRVRHLRRSLEYHRKTYGQPVPDLPVLLRKLRSARVRAWEKLNRY